MDNYKIISDRIEQFIRKYYLNQLIKGGLITLSIIGIMILLLVMPEAQFYFSETIRTVLFFVFVFAAVVLLAIYVALPLFKLIKLKKGLSRYEAAKIIGSHFDDVKDKLLNVLQLEEKYELSDREADLLKASIDQRSRQLSGVPFKKAVDLSKNRKYLLRFAGVAGLLAVGFILFPRSFTESAGRIMKYNQHFEKPQPFYYEILNDSLEVVQNKAFTVRFTTSGDEIPDKVYLHWGGNRILAEEVSSNSFQYTFNGLNNDRTFYLQSGKITSTQYRINVRPLPIILEFDVNLDYPEYTSKKDETIKNSGDIFVPEGTKAAWSFYTKDLNTLYFKSKDSVHRLEANQSNKFQYNQKLFQNFQYSVHGSNQYLATQDTVTYEVNVIKDQYPEISVDKMSDSVDIDRIFFTGVIQDDYGLTGLVFRENIIRGRDTLNTSTPVDITSNSKQKFYYSATFDSLKLQEGDIVRYYFEVYDNDAVNGHKFSRSRIFTFKQPSAEEIEERSEKSEKEINSRLSKSLNKSRDLEQQLEDMRSDMMNKKNLNWEDKEKVKNAMEDLEDLKKSLENIRKKSEKNRKFEEQFDKSDKELLDKQKELEELMDKVLNEELKKLMDEIRKMMEDMNKEKMNQLLDKMKMSNESMKEQLDRSIEMYKQLQFQKDLEKAIDKAGKLAEEQKELKKLSEDTPRREIDKLTKEQKGLENKTDSLQKDLNKLEQKDKELQNSNGFKSPKKQTEEIKKSMQESSQQLNKKNKNKAGEKMQESSENLFELSKNLKQQQQSMQEQKLAEDIDNLKQILENLVDISFEQEALITNFKALNKNDPRYVEKMQEQYGLQEKLKKVKDSLKALSKRQTMIEPFVLKEIKSIDNNMGKSLRQLKERNVRSGTSRQQYVMTHVNNLSLLLAEALENMQQNMNAMGSGSGQSKQQGVPKMSEIRKMQQQLQQQMQKMKQGMKKNQKGGGKPSMSEEMARMAAKQAAIRKKLQQYRKELMKQGKGDQGLNKTIKKMDENETDMVNKRITEELIKRQEKIVSRLLESEKAQREQDKQKQREAETAKSYEKRNPNEFLKYKEIKTNNKEVLKTIPPEVNPYYRQRINEYFIEEQTEKK